MMHGKTIGLNATHNANEMHIPLLIICQTFAPEGPPSQFVNHRAEYLDTTQSTTSQTQMVKEIQTLMVCRYPEIANNTNNGCNKRDSLLFNTTKL